MVETHEAQRWPDPTFRRPITLSMIDLLFIGGSMRLAMALRDWSGDLIFGAVTFGVVLLAVARLRIYAVGSVEICGAHLIVRYGLFLSHTERLPISRVRTWPRASLLGRLPGWGRVHIQIDGQELLTPLISSANLLCWAIEERARLVQIQQIAQPSYEINHPGVALLERETGG